MNILTFSGKTSFRKIITLNEQEYEHFSLSEIPTSFGCITHKEKPGISNWINFKGLTYYLKD
jgi:hypothetical protein